MCEHGVEVHPLWPDKVLRTGRTWIRSKYVDRAGRCVVCHGEPAPDDFPYDRNVELAEAALPAWREVVDDVFQPMPVEVSDALPYVEE